MSIASDLLAVGFDVLLEIHGESFTYRPAGDATLTEHGEAVTSESQDAILGGDDSSDETVNAIFDNEYLVTDPAGASYGNTTPAIFVRSSDVPSAKRNDIWTRAEDGAVFYAQAVRADSQGCKLILLSTDIH